MDTSESLPQPPVSGERPTDAVAADEVISRMEHSRSMHPVPKDDAWTLVAEIRRLRAATIPDGLREASEAATQGAWHLHRDGSGTSIAVHNPDNPNPGVCGYEDWDGCLGVFDVWPLLGSPNLTDAQFIAAAVNFVRSLLAAAPPTAEPAMDPAVEAEVRRLMRDRPALNAALYAAPTAEPGERDDEAWRTIIAFTCGMCVDEGNGKVWFPDDRELRRHMVRVHILPARPAEAPATADRTDG